MHAVGRWILGKKNCCVKRGEGVKITTKFCERYEIHVMCVYVCHVCVHYTRDTTVVVFNRGHSSNLREIPNTSHNSEIYHVLH